MYCQFLKEHDRIAGCMSQDPCPSLEWPRWYCNLMPISPDQVQKRWITRYATELEVLFGDGTGTTHDNTLYALPATEGKTLNVIRPEYYSPWKMCYAALRRIP